ncbi:hypothetical protein Y694_02338 [Methylibium sp. T29-B]|nr:hypothetical protein Y694_02338 [Methylibium sp. T29-B]
MMAESQVVGGDAEVGVKWTWKRGCRASEFLMLGVLCVA